MTISCYEGLPGSGKSYDAVRKLLDSLKAGRRVLTNIDGVQHEKQRITIQHYMDLQKDELDKLLIYLPKDKVSKFWEYTENGDIIFIDEAQNFFNSRDWQTDTNRNLGRWASEHRKRGNDVVFITQDMAGIESSVRRIVEWVYRYKKLNMFGSAIQKKYIRFAYYGQGAEPLGKTICTYDKKIFACYSSYFADGTKELGIEKPVNVLKHPVILAIPVMIGIFIYFFSNSSIVTGDYFGQKAIVESFAVDNIEEKEIKRVPSKMSIRPGLNSKSNDEILIVLGVVNGKKIIQNQSGSIYLR